MSFLFNLIIIFNYLFINLLAHLQIYLIVNLLYHFCLDIDHYRRLRLQTDSTHSKLEAILADTKSGKSYKSQIFKL